MLVWQDPSYSPLSPGRQNLHNINKQHPTSSERGSQEESPLLHFGHNFQNLHLYFLVSIVRFHILDLHFGP